MNWIYMMIGFALIVLSHWRQKPNKQRWRRAILGGIGFLFLAYGFFNLFIPPFSDPTSTLAPPTGYVVP